MSRPDNKVGGTHPGEKGQGAVEAIVALPAFLLLAAVLLQTALLGTGQILLQYAAFCAARTGAVRDADRKQMETAAGRILALSPGTSLLPGKPFRLEIQTSDTGKGRAGKGETPVPGGILSVKIHWEYPLVVPLAGSMLSCLGDRPSWRDPSITLRAAWNIVFEPAIRRKEREAP